MSSSPSFPVAGHQHVTHEQEEPLPTEVLTFLTQWHPAFPGPVDLEALVQSKWYYDRQEAGMMATQWETSGSLVFLT